VIVEGSLPATLDASAHEHHARRALGDAKRHLQKSALKLVGYLVAAYAVLKLIPTLEQALRSLEHESWEWCSGRSLSRSCPSSGSSSPGVRSSTRRTARS